MFQSGTVASFVTFTCRGCSWCRSKLTLRGARKHCFCLSATSARNLGNRLRRSLVKGFVGARFHLGAAAERS